MMLNIDWEIRQLDLIRRSDIIARHKDMPYDVALYRYKFAYDKHHSYPMNTKYTDNITGETYFSWSDEDFERMMYWEYVEKYYKIVCDGKKVDMERSQPLSKEFKNKDIIITDPCYILDEIDWYNNESHDGILMRDTIYGDWSCTTYNTDTNEVIGEFCADGGMVCVVELDNEKVNQSNLNGLPAHCRTIIRNFSGTVYIKRCATGGVHDAIEVHGTGSINFIGKQTGV